MQSVLNLNTNVR